MRLVEKSKKYSLAIEQIKKLQREQSLRNDCFVGVFFQ
ncbi:hypothetical protein BI355_2064 [Companilactobacillus crustorum]|nr:hypothetical protein BI355_2064 [Companilactobacillus crustorum]